MVQVSACFTYSAHAVQEKVFIAEVSLCVCIFCFDSSRVSHDLHEISNGFWAYLAIIKHYKIHTLIT